MFLTLLAQTTPTPTGTGSPGTATGGSQIFSLLFIVVLGVVFYAFMIRPQRQRQKRQQAVIQELKIGDEVQTIAGMFGNIVQLSDEFAWVELAPGTTIKMLRRAVIGKAGPPEAPATGEAETGTTQ